MITGEVILSKSLNIILLIVIGFLILSFNACVDDPQPTAFNQSESDSYAVVLCEGLSGSNKAELYFYSYNDNQPLLNVKLPEENLVLGDIGNDMVMDGDTCYISLSGSGIISRWDINTKTKINDIQLPQGAVPRHLALDNRFLYSTDLNADLLYRIDLDRDFATDSYSTGPAPEGVVVTGEIAFVQNSGLGQLRQDEEFAGTISKINLASGLTEHIEVGINPDKILMNTSRTRLYATYLSYYWLKDSDTETDSSKIGGIKEFSLPNMQLLREWRTTPIDVSFGGDESMMFIITDSGLSSIRLNGIHGEVTELVNNKEDKWYALGVDDFEKKIWIANSKDFQSRGEIILYDINSNSIQASVQTGYLPNVIRFIK